MPTAQQDFAQRIPTALERRADEARAVGATIVVTVTGEGGGTWTLSLNENLGLREGPCDDAAASFELSSEAWAELSDDPSKMAPLFFAGRIDAQGTIMYGMKLPMLLAE